MALSSRDAYEEEEEEETGPLLRLLPDLTAWAKDQDLMVMVRKPSCRCCLQWARSGWLSSTEKWQAFRFCMHVASACIYQH